MINLFGSTLTEIEKILIPLKVPKFRAKQIAEWMYQKSVDNFFDMTNLSRGFREQLSEKFVIQKAKLITEWNSSDEKTTKYLLAFYDGTTVEAVLMRHDYGNSVCVSTQAGCAMGCAFCASTLHGVTRNLSAGEMLAEVLFINERLKKQQQKVDTLVLMGSGEPFMNYNNVLKFIRLLHESYTLNMGYRNITVSTSGIVPEIYKFAEEGIPVNLSISLHAPDNEIRSMLMPVNKKYCIEEVVKAAVNYAAVTKRRITYEYILIDRINDTPEAAEKLVQLLKNKLASVNLIPINPVKERNLNRPSQERIDAFEKILSNKHINVTVRREMGTDIQAACGQLRNKHLAE